MRDIWCASVYIYVYKLYIYKYLKVCGDQEPWLSLNPVRFFFYMLLLRVPFPQPDSEKSEGIKVRYQTNPLPSFPLHSITWEHERKRHGTGSTRDRNKEGATTTESLGDLLYNEAYAVVASRHGQCLLYMDPRTNITRYLERSKVCYVPRKTGDYMLHDINARYTDIVHSVPQFSNGFLFSDIPSSSRSRIFSVSLHYWTSMFFSFFSQVFQKKKIILFILIFNFLILSIQLIYSRCQYTPMTFNSSNVSQNQLNLRLRSANKKPSICPPRFNNSAQLISLLIS